MSRRFPSFNLGRQKDREAKGQEEKKPGGKILGGKLSGGKSPLACPCGHYASEANLRYLPTETIHIAPALTKSSQDNFTEKLDMSIVDGSILRLDEMLQGAF